MEMEMCRIRFYMQTPIAVNSPIHLDGLLSAVHPCMHGRDYLPTKFDDGSDLIDVPLPLCSFRAGESWVWACTAGEAPEGAKFSTDSLTKRRTAQDVFEARRSFLPGSGTMRDRFVTFQTLETPYIDFLCLTNCGRQLKRLVKRVQAIGGKRKSGWGMVREAEITSLQTEFADYRDCMQLLLLEGQARRRLPAEFIASEVKTNLQCHPPYWHPSRVEPGCEVGDEIVLAEGITVSPKRGVEYAL